VIITLKRAVYGGEGLVNLVVNGDFESPPLTHYSRFGPSSTNITGWTVNAAPPDGVQVGATGTIDNVSVCERLE